MQGIWNFLICIRTSYFRDSFSATVYSKNKTLKSKMPSINDDAKKICHESALKLKTGEVSSALNNEDCAESAAISEEAVTASNNEDHVECKDMLLQ
jgi:hypothetical protein